MDINEIRDIMQVTTKLQSTFRHIRYMCGKYLELETGVPSYSPYGEFGSMGYMQSSGFGQEAFYPPTQFGNMYEAHMTPVTMGMGGMNGHIGGNMGGQMVNGHLGAQMVNGHMMNDSTKKIPITKKVGQLNTKPLTIQHSTTKPPPTQPSQQQPTKKPPTTSSPLSSTSPLKPPTSKPPTLPASPYHLFLTKKRDQIKKQYPQLNEEQMQEIMAEVWKSFNPGEKEPYEVEWRRLKRPGGEKKDEGRILINGKPSTSDIAISLRSQLLK